MKIVVGLGNPGSKYENTRHNYGFMVIDELVRRHRVSLASGSFSAQVGSAVLHGEKVLFVKPLTFMNNSGQAVGALCRYYRVEPDDVAIIYDDMAIPLGHIRIREKGSAGGHNGMKSIIASLGTQEFPRIRLGIGSPEGSQVVDYVLSPFSKAERAIVSDVIPKATDAVEEWLQNGTAQAMSRFNGPAVEPDEKG